MSLVEALSRRDGRPGVFMVACGVKSPQEALSVAVEVIAAAVESGIDPDEAYYAVSDRLYPRKEPAEGLHPHRPIE